MEVTASVQAALQALSQETNPGGKIDHGLGPQPDSRRVRRQVASSRDVERLLAISDIGADVQGRH